MKLSRIFQSHQLEQSSEHYELGNHLGNVLAVVTDNIHMADDLTTTAVASASDYYPFGLQMDSRTVNDGDYRFGFNGKEKDDKGEFGNTHYDYGFRIYNPAIAKFLSVDPLTKSYPMLTPYQFASNTPISASDLDGLEARIDITFNQEDEDYLNGIRTYNEIKADRDARAVGAIMGAGIVLTRGAILRYGDRIVPWLYSNPTAPMTGTAVLWGAFLDEEFPGPTHVDDAARNARKTGKVMLDVFGGSKTKIRGAINVDPLANSGVPKEIGELFDLAKRKNLLGTVDEIFATNPQAEFLNEAAGLLREGGALKVTGNYSNPYFRKIWKQIQKGAIEIDGFKVKKSYKGVPDELAGNKFYQNDGTTEIPFESLKTVELEKINK